MCGERKIMKRQMSPAGFAEVDRAADPAELVRVLDRNESRWREARQRVDAALDLRAGERVLDVGCGTGEQVRALAARVGPTGRAVGVDRSATMLAEARERGRGARSPAAYRLGDAYALPFPRDAFDACLAEKLFAHLARPGQALAEMCRVARAGGRVVVASVDAETMVLDVPDRALTRRILNHWCDTRSVNGWAGRQLPRLFREAGLVDIAIWPVTAQVTRLDRGAEGFAFRERAEEARASGVASAEEVAGWIAELEAADRDGRFFSALTAFVVAGRKP
jgi:ubiquinone/menaquinone biosynthesis C-methylase UbiE